MSKTHSVTVTITSESDGVVNQTVALKEYAATPEELVVKNFTVTDYVMPAVDAAMKAMAEAAGFPTELPKKPKGP